MKWIYENPDEPGKYIVVTYTKKLNSNILYTFWNGKNWNFSNQIFIKYLRE